MKTVFSPGKIGNRKFPNRFVAQSMEMNCADADGRVGSRILQRYRDLARGQWGIVFVEAISVTAKHVARKRGLVLNKRTLPSFKKLIDSFKKVNDQTLIMFQLNHSGRYSSHISRKVCAYVDDQDIHVLTEKELDTVRDQFIDAVQLSYEAGADGVDIKSCHGYLGGELLRPLNVRNDRYGGSVENRSRILTDVLRESRGIDSNFILGTRISVYEGIRGGCGTPTPADIVEDLDDMTRIIRRVVEAGADYINVSAGIPLVTPYLTRPQNNNFFDMYHHFRYAREIKKRFRKTAVIGSAYSAAKENAVLFADENISRGYVDLAGFGRQNLADPLFPVRYMEDPRSVHYCTLCGGCSRLLREQKRVRCILHEKE